MKNELKLTPKQQEKISRFLSMHLQTLEEENRIGLRHYRWDFGKSQHRRDKTMLEDAIRKMAETIWE
jgi:hypothetical protein